MATVINTRQPVESDNSLGMLLGVVLLIVVIGMFLIYGLPRLVGGYGSASPSVNLPSSVNVHSGN